MHITIDNEDILLAPYAWKRTGRGPGARAEACMPGAYVRAAFANASDVDLRVRGAGNSGCPAHAMPIIDYSIDFGPFQSAQLSRTDEEYVIPLMHGGDARTPHHVDVFFRSARLEKERWHTPRNSLCIAGFSVNDGASAEPAPRRRGNAICFGDSITEGVYSALPVLEPGTVFYGTIAHNDARTTWVPLVCSALGCEYGQIGTGGQGMVARHLQVPPLTETWDHFDGGSSRLDGGRLLPEPDYVFCEMCTNDFVTEAGTRRHLDVTEAYLRFLGALRVACPAALVFCVEPPFGWHAQELAHVVSASRARGDARVHLIETAPLRHLFKVDTPTQVACDGIHMHVYGHALLGAYIAAEAQKAICRSAMS